MVDLTGSEEVHKVNSVLKALEAEKQKWLRQWEEARQQLQTVEAAMKLVSGKATGKVKKRSAAARKKMSLAAKKRWQKVRAAK